MRRTDGVKLLQCALVRPPTDRPSVVLLVFAQSGSPSLGSEPTVWRKGPRLDPSERGWCGDASIRQRYSPAWTVGKPIVSVGLPWAQGVRRSNRRAPTSIPCSITDQDQTSVVTEFSS